MSQTVKNEVARPSSSGANAGLNVAQQKAVSLPLDAHALVLAGAGTGKTSVLTHRIARLVSHGIDPQSIVAITFTNKAAQSMRSRVMQVAGSGAARALRMGTFHAIGMRLMRRWHLRAGFSRPPGILDEADKEKMLRAIYMRQSMAAGIQDEEAQEIKKFIGVVISRIDAWQNDNRMPEDVVINSHADTIAHAYYALYQAEKRKQNVVDFGDLLVLPNHICVQEPGYAKRWQSEISCVLVDEFQDTNNAQYAMLRHMGGDGTTFFAVGDDDQAIYEWRGAQPGILARFVRDHQGCVVIRLEQNYRSTPTILDAANAVIAHNEKRLGKNLWTDRDHVATPTINVIRVEDAQAEARWVAKSITEAHADGTPLNEIAVLYRTNFLSRRIGIALVHEGIPHQVYGDLGFYEREEIRTALAYLRLAHHRDDRYAFLRAVNIPARGIGAKTVDKLVRQADQENLSLAACASANPRAYQKMQSFLRLLDDDLEIYRTNGLTALTIAVTERLLDFYRQRNRDSDKDRPANLAELRTATREAERRLSQDSPDIDMLDAFLQESSLETDGPAHGQSRDIPHVSLMSIHRAKGLEFQKVMVVGMERGIMPHPKGDAEEERRLMYVAMTRAKMHLTLLHVLRRQAYDRVLQEGPSPFLKEIPEQHCSCQDLSYSAR